jgi:hypothetical protein
MANYSTLTAAQQSAIDDMIAVLSPLVGEFARLLTKFQACDAQYLSVASAALAMLTPSEFSGTNLATTSGTSANPVVTSATHNFTSDEVGNLINVTAGTSWTPGLYEIKSVAANAATLDRPVGTAATLTAGTWAVLAMVPNSVGLAAAQPKLSRADVVSMVSHLESALTSFNDAGHRNLWAKACGPSNLM